jgi:hypothetical protein
MSTGSDSKSGLPDHADQTELIPDVLNITDHFEERLQQFIDEK